MKKIFRLLLITIKEHFEGKTVKTLLVCWYLVLFSRVSNFKTCKLNLIATSSTHAYEMRIAKKEYLSKSR